MMNRKLLLATVVGAGIFAAFASQALPLHALGFDGRIISVANAGDHEHEGKDHHAGTRQHGNEDGHSAANHCREDDDDDGAARGGRGTPMPQDATPPSNGLFTPGTKPRAQMN